jgi:hypothetical protein
MKLLEEPKVQILRYDPGNFDAKGDLINKDVIASLLPFLNTYAEFVKKSKQWYENPECLIYNSAIWIEIYSKYCYS